MNVSFRQEGEHFEKHGVGHQTELLERIRTIAPLTYTTSSAPHEVSYHLKLKDAAVVQEVLSIVQDNQDAYGVSSYSVMGTSIEDIFLGLMHDDMRGEDKELEKPDSAEAPSLSASPTPTPPVLELTNGRRRSS